MYSFKCVFQYAKFTFTESFSKNCKDLSIAPIDWKPNPNFKIKFIKDFFYESDLLISIERVWK